MLDAASAMLLRHYAFSAIFFADIDCSPPPIAFAACCYAAFAYATFSLLFACLMSPLYGCRRYYFAYAYAQRHTRAMLMPAMLAIH